MRCECSCVASVCACISEWSHANISLKRKVELYNAIVLPQLLYNLESLWLIQRDRHRLDSFHVQCLRRICRVPCAYVSRVSNQDIIDRTGQDTLSERLAKQQIKMYTSITQLPESDVLRKLTCEPNAETPRVWNQRRRRGRPKQQWAHCVHALKRAAE